MYKIKDTGAIQKGKIKNKKRAELDYSRLDIAKETIGQLENTGLRIIQTRHREDKKLGKK